MMMQVHYSPSPPSSDTCNMVITLGQANKSVAVIHNLLNVQQILSPRYSINWGQVLGVLAAERTEWDEPQASPETINKYMSY